MEKAAILRQVTVIWNHDELLIYKLVKLSCSASLKNMWKMAFSDTTATSIFVKFEQFTLKHFQILTEIWKFGLKVDSFFKTFLTKAL